MYRASVRAGSGYAAARGGFLSGLGRAVGRVVRGVARVGVNFIPGPAGAIARGVVGGGRQTMPGGLSLSKGPQRPVPGLRGRVQRLLPGGETGYYSARRMNAGNAKAARRAIRRIKAVRKLLQSIERELPRRPAARGSAGVITRREAARALRS